MSESLASLPTPSHSSAMNCKIADDDEAADEVKVFRTNDADETDIASSSAELTADKKDLALEAEIESSQTEPMGQRMITPLQSAFNCPSPSYNFLVPLFMSSPSPLSPCTTMPMPMQMSPSYTMAQMHLAAAAANLARHSPTYMNHMQHNMFNQAAAAAAASSAFPGMSMGTPSQAPNFNPSPSRSNQPPNHINSPLTSVANGINGLGLNGDIKNITPQQRAAYAAHRVNPQGQSTSASASHVNPNLMKTPKREKPQKNQQSAIAGTRGGQQKQSAMLNQQLGKIWQGMAKKDQQRYYDLAAQEREDHQKKYPMWTARENYAIHKKKKKKREKSMENNDQKKCRARFGVEHQDQWCKHCKRKKRCLNVRENDSPMVSSTTNTPNQQMMLSSAASSQSSHAHSPMSSTSGMGMSIGKRSESNSSSSYDPNTPPPQTMNGQMNGFLKSMEKNMGKIEPQDIISEMESKPAVSHLGNTMPPTSGFMTPFNFGNFSYPLTMPSSTSENHFLNSNSNNNF
uniref:HMG box domain-containing protein n=1 Tax=Ditylenchus dipsaci TaxID=166011 RepID=A0A915DEG8_9BILA